jgi:protein O-mannosyl-transferase
MDKNPNSSKKSIPKKPELAKTYVNKFPLLFYLLFGIICLAIHAQTLTFDFTHFDDDSLILDKQFYLSNFHNIPDAFRRDAMLEQKFSSFYRPLQTITYIIDWHISKNRAFGYHLTNLILYCITCLLVFYLLSLLFPLVPTFETFLISLGFAINPFLAQAVAWIPARGDLLLALFGVLACIFLIQFEKQRKSIFIVLHFLSFVLALFSKETAAILPVVFLALIPPGEPWKSRLRRFIPAIAMWGIFIAVYLLIRSAAIGNSADLSGLFVQMVHNVRVIPEMMARFVLPIRNSPLPAFDGFALVFGLILLLFIFIRFIRDRTNFYRTAQGIIWFIALNLPAMTFSNKASSGYDYLCHRGFLPLVGFLIIILSILPSSWFRLKTFRTLSFSVVVAYLAITIRYERIFSNPLDFYNAAIKTNPSSPSAYLGRAVLRKDMNDLQGAYSDYQHALQLCPGDQMELINRGNIAAEMGDTASAFEDFKSLMSIYPKWAKPWLDRGRWRLNAGNIIGAKNDFESALQIDSTYSDAYNNLGTIFLMESDTNSAEKYYAKAFSLDPSHKDARYNYGLIRLWKKDIAGACEAWRIAASQGSRQAQESLVNHCNN